MASKFIQLAEDENRKTKHAFPLARFEFHVVVNHFLRYCKRMLSSEEMALVKSVKKHGNSLPKLSFQFRKRIPDVHRQLARVCMLE